MNSDSLASHIEEEPREESQFFWKCRPRLQWTVTSDTLQCVSTKREKYILSKKYNFSGNADNGVSLPPLIHWQCHCNVFWWFALPLYWPKLFFFSTKNKKYIFKRIPIFEEMQTPAISDTRLVQCNVFWWLALSLVHALVRKRETHFHNRAQWRASQTIHSWSHSW